MIIQHAYLKKENEVKTVLKQPVITAIPIAA
jgi:hypothetical protein